MMEPVGSLPPAEGGAADALRRIERTAPTTPPRLAPTPPDLRALEQAGAWDLLAGEVELDQHARAAVRHRGFAVRVGWVPSDQLPALAERLAAVGSEAVELPAPEWSDPPTLLRPSRPVRSFRLLVETYGTAPYRDVDPTAFAAVSFVGMFGMMFGDAGHGLVLALLAALLPRAKAPALASLKPLRSIGIACGLSAAFFGLLYGEAFGPTGLVPTLWVSPTDQPLRVLIVGIAVGTALLLSSYGFGIVNRWREHGPRAALEAASGVAGLLVLVGSVLLAFGVYEAVAPLELAGAVMLVAGAVLMSSGFLREAGHGATAVTQAAIEVADAILRVAANVVSFARLAAFGLMHAAIGAVVLDGAAALWGGAIGSLLAVGLFVAGNALAFALEALVAGVQALRLEYYELFSRVFSGEGHPFTPWRVPRTPAEGMP